MEEKNLYNGEKLTFSIIGSIIILLCVGCLLACSVLYFHQEPEKCELNLTYVPDSTLVSTSDLNKLQESLELYIQDTEQRIDNRYGNFIEQKEQSQDILVICSTIIGIILALFGFLGYKSLRDLENETKEKAISLAQDTVIKEVDKTVPTEVQTKVKAEVQNLVPKEISKEIDRTYKDGFDKTRDLRMANIVHNTIISKDLQNIKDEVLEEVKALVNDKYSILNERLNKIDSSSTDEPPTDSIPSEDTSTSSTTVPTDVDDNDTDTTDKDKDEDEDNKSECDF